MNKRGLLTFAVMAIIVIALIVGGVWYYEARHSQIVGAPSGQTTGSSSPTSTIQYRNAQYGFTFSLPPDWAGYSIATDTWTSDSADNVQPTYQGPIILIRNPLWTASDQYQDIPIMIFTIDEWNAVSTGTILVSAAPFPPTELGSNNRYVFALPPRYNYAYLSGYEEVQRIIDSMPLQGFN